MSMTINYIETIERLDMIILTLFDIVTVSLNYFQNYDMLPLFYVIMKTSSYLFPYLDMFPFLLIFGSLHGDIF